MAAVAAMTGAVGALLHVPTIASLWQTSYGQALLVKLALVAAAAGLGAWNWRRMKPRLAEGEPPERLRRTAAAELLVGALVLLATAILVALPTP
jgi:putative copper export protein